jgi:Putative bacterial sensory transduction regulator
MKTRHLITLALMLAASVSTGAEAQQVNASDPQAIVKLISGKGYQAEIINTSSVPAIRSSDSGVTFIIFFMNCELDKNCKSLQFYTGFADMAVPLDKLNKWNSAHRFARTYLDDETDPVMEMDINLDYGGVSEANFIDTFTIWLDLLSQFRTLVVQGSTTSDGNTAPSDGNTAR